MDVRLGEGLVDAGLIGIECSAALQHEGDGSNGRCRFLTARFGSTCTFHGIVLF
jgi:hypothetical protein